MKTAIITITDGANYGNRLQNYALQTALTALGGECETLRRNTSRDVGLLGNTFSVMKDCCKAVLGRKTNQVYRIRKRVFDDFNERYIHWSKAVLEKNTAPDGLSNMYDFFVCGSDQIWNAKFDVIKEDIMNYLAFFSDPEKRISYAASFGTDKVDENYQEYFKKELPKFKAISVREYSGIDIVKTFTDKQSELVIDPTMLLTVEEWKTILKKPTYIKDNTAFIVTYFMSGRDNKIQQYIDRVKREMNCDTVINLDIEFIARSDIENDDVFCTSPDEFLWLIYNSKAVLTDSFHATVFSLLFHKPFCVFERKATEQGNNMGSRIDTLLGYFDLECMKDDINDPSVIPKNYDGNKVEEIITRKRDESLNFLKSALGLTE